MLAHIHGRRVIKHNRSIEKMIYARLVLTGAPDWPFTRGSWFGVFKLVKKLDRNPTGKTGIFSSENPAQGRPPTVTRRPNISGILAASAVPP